LVVAAAVLAVVPLFDFVVLGPAPRIVVGLVFVLFVPGYALVAALFPSHAPQVGGWRGGGLTDRASDVVDRVSGVDRFVLSFGLSVLIVPLIALFLSFLSIPLEAWSLLQTIAAVSIGLAVVAAVRRLRLPADERYAADPIAWASRGAERLFDGEDATGKVLNLLLVVGLVVAMSGIVYAVAMPKQPERYTEFYLLSEDPETGELVAGDYPSEFESGETTPVYLGVENMEHQPVSYTVVVELQRFQDRGDESVLVQETELARFSRTLAHNETYRTLYPVQPTFGGDSLRVTFLLYRGTPPGDPATSNAYRHVHFWIESSA
jgi:uncharacterized membrane protein